mmetsp:Transcript_14975/g.35698  ORF Transcript_14975/g.35698 Transcript_14975/m.35698 type:complete len:475 (+) Transcript_14975:271-1695(+)
MPAQAQEDANSRVTKRRWFKTFSNLKQQVTAAERLADIPSGVCSELEKCKANQATEFRKEQRQIWSKCENMKALVASAKAKAENCQPDAASITALAETLENVESSMATLKDNFRQDYNSLMDEEELLLRELDAFTSRLQSPAWEEAEVPEAGPSGTHRPPLGRRTQEDGGNSGNGGLLPEVIMFEEFRAEYGDTGNWHPEEHKEFLRILKSCRYDYGEAVMVCCDRILVGFEREDIIAHARWHQEYSDLEAKKRMAIAEWKERKALEREAAKASAMPCTTAQEAWVDRDKKAKEQAWRLQQKEALSEWREAKRLQAEREAEEAKRREEAALMAQARELEERLQTKAVLEEHRLKRQQEQQQGRGAPEQRPRTAPLSREDRERLQERERRAERLRAERLEAREAEQRAASERARALREKLGPKADRDVGRLLSSTTAARSRALAREEEQATGAHAPDQGFIRHVQRRATPSYMRG